MKETSGQEPEWRYCLRLVLNILIPASGWILAQFAGPRLLKFFMPFVIGLVISMIANPLVRFLERRLRLVRRHSSLLIVAAVLALVIGLLYLVISRQCWPAGHSSGISLSSMGRWRRMCARDLISWGTAFRFCPRA